MSHRKGILRLMRASLKSKKTPRRLKAGLRAKIRVYIAEERREAEAKR